MQSGQTTNFGFIDLNDGSTLPCLQVVFEAERLGNYKEIAKQNVGASVAVKGIFELTPGAKQAFELKATEIEVTGTSTPDYPLQKKRHSDEFLRTIAHLRPRTNKYEAVFRVRSVAAYAIHKFFQERNFVYVHTPIITGSDCEGAGEMFRVTTLDPDSLPRTPTERSIIRRISSASRQISPSPVSSMPRHMRWAFAKVYTFGPTFRAEKSNTPRHAAEFWMMEPEIAFADLDDDMELIESMLKYVVAYIMKECPRELELFDKFIDTTLLDRLHNIVGSDFARVTYTEAIKLLKESGVTFEYPIDWGSDLQTEHERYLTEKVYGRPVFVTDWPRDIKAFYMRVNDDGKTVAAVDLLVPGVGELVGGSQREERLDVLLESIKKFGLDENDYSWYVDLRRYGGAKHAGLRPRIRASYNVRHRIGNIRDVESFPRTTGSADF